MAKKPDTVPSRRFEEIVRLDAQLTIYTVPSVPRRCSILSLYRDALRGVYCGKCAECIKRRHVPCWRFMNESDYSAALRLARLWNWPAVPHAAGTRRRTRSKDTLSLRTCLRTLPFSRPRTSTANERLGKKQTSIWYTPVYFGKERASSTTSIQLIRAHSHSHLKLKSYFHFYRHTGTETLSTAVSIIFSFRPNQTLPVAS